MYTHAATVTSRLKTAERRSMEGHQGFAIQPRPPSTPDTPEIARRRLDLPQPEGPTISSDCPGSTARSRAWSSSVRAAVRACSAAAEFCI